MGSKVLLLNRNAVLSQSPRLRRFGATLGSTSAHIQPGTGCVIEYLTTQGSRIRGNPGFETQPLCGSKLKNTFINNDLGPTCPNFLRH